MTRPGDPLLAALLDKLPESGSPWLPTERAAWLRAFEAALHLVYPPVSDPAPVGRDSPRVRELIATHGDWVLAEFDKLASQELESTI